MFVRNVDKYLVEWSTRKDRKPLVIRGARQVGKTTLVDQFARSFPTYIYYNLERPKDLELFESSSSMDNLVDRIMIERELTKAELNEALLFIDEIQESERALSFLRFFYEQYPHIHLICSGSLLEHALTTNIKVPVGRVEYLVLHPFNFEEFLQAMNKRVALQALQVLPPADHTHSQLLELFEKYIVIGGMPEAVSTYVEDSKDIHRLERTYESLLQGYIEDMEKYASNSAERNILRHILKSIPNYVQQRITFQKFGNSNYKSREVGEAMRSLQMARLIELVYPITQTSIPIATNLRRRPKLHFIDCGLLFYSLGLKAHSTELTKLNDDFRGKMIEQVLFQEVKSKEISPLFQSKFWVRVKADAGAEVDMIYQYDSFVIPIEIKSGPVGKLRSLHEFMDRADHPYAIRFYKGPFHIHEVTTKSDTTYLLMNLPLYLGTQLRRLTGWFIEEYSQS